MTAGVFSWRLGALATDQVGRALYSHFFDGSRRPVNFARFVFLDQRGKGVLRRLRTLGRGLCRAASVGAGRNPFDRQSTLRMCAG